MSSALGRIHELLTVAPPSGAANRPITSEHESVFEQARRLAATHRGGRRQRQALGQLPSKAPLPVVPASVDVTQLKVREIRMLIPQQRAPQVLPELTHGPVTHRCERFSSRSG